MKLKNSDTYLILPNLENSYQDSPYNSIVQGKSSTSTIFQGGGSDESILFLIFFWSFFVLFLKKASPGRDYPPNMHNIKCILFSGILIVLFGNRKYWKKNSVTLWKTNVCRWNVKISKFMLEIWGGREDTAGFRWCKSINPCISE